MTWSRMLCRSLLIAVLAAGLLLLAVACGSDPTPTATPQPEATEPPQPTATAAPTAAAPAPTETPTPVPQASPTPEPTATPSPGDNLSELLASVEASLAAMATADFDMVDETESGAPFFGTTFKGLAGQVKSPDSFWMLVKVVAPGLGFAEIEMVAVGDEAYMKFSKGAPWTPLPLEQVPFNFGEIGITLSQLIPALSDVSLTGTETVGETQTIVIEGTIPSEGMGNLITGVDAGHTITLTFWVDETDHSLRRLRIGGMLFNDDAPETNRLLDIKGVNVPVDIQLPDSSSQ